MTAPLVSVVIPAFNSARDLPRAIESVLSQDVDGLELIVIDDGSVDETIEVVKHYGERVRYFWQPNQGQGAARNHGVRQSRGRFVAFLDADDFWLPGKLRVQIDEMLRRPAVKLVSCGARVQDRNGRVLREVVRNNFPTRLALRRVLSIAQAIPGSASGVLVDRRCLEALGGFDESMRTAEDWDMWLRIVERFEASFIPEVFVVVTAGGPAPDQHRDPEVERPWLVLEHQMVAVSRVIEKSVPPGRRRRAYAALHARIGIGYLSQSRKSEAVRHLWKSIRLRPLNLYPLDPRNRYMLPRPSRYVCLCIALAGILGRREIRERKTVMSEKS